MAKPPLYPTLATKGTGPFRRNLWEGAGVQGQGPGESTHSKLERWEVGARGLWIWGLLPALGKLSWG